MAVVVVSVLIGDGRVGHTAERGVETAEIDIERLELGAPVVVESGLNVATHGESRARRVRRKSREGSRALSTSSESESALAF